MTRLGRYLMLLTLAGMVFSAGAGEPLPSSVYVWQRAWTAPVGSAVAEHGTNFAEVVVLGAEVTWKKNVPQLARVAPDYPVLASLHRPVGLALRVGPYHGTGALGEDAAAVRYLSGVAASLVAAARKGGVGAVELQIDYDCATARLADYSHWLAEVQRQLAPLPVTVTALPAWLASPAFAGLAAEATNYVLQVHSLEKPVSVDRPFTLCDPVSARVAVARAAALGVPFRVALPTYAYQVAFRADGKFAGLSAEAARVDWPAGTQLRVMAADPLAMSGLVREWSAQRPPALQGILWYRLPVAGDNFNWRWPTLAAIVAGHEPREHFFATARRVEAGLVEIHLVNDGELDVTAPVTVRAHWPAARLVAGDGLQGFELGEPSGGAAIFDSPAGTFRLSAGENQTVGWLRLDREEEVQLEMEKR